MITKKDIKKLEEVGRALDGDLVYHLETKGGLHKMLKKKKDGTYVVLGRGNHRGIAKVMASRMEKNITWHESLFKSEHGEKLKKIKGDSLPESNIKTHTQQAVYYAHLLKKSIDPIKKAYYALQSMSHLMAAGLNKKEAEKSVDKILKKLQKNGIMEMPYNEELLQLAYEIKHNKPFPRI